MLKFEEERYMGVAKPASGGGGGGSTPVIESLSVTPSTSAQTITAPSGTDGYSPVSVAAVTAAIDANIIAENIKKDVTILSVTGTYEGSGGGGGGGDYELLTRVTDDNNNEIGTVSGYITDNYGIKYAVVLLDAQYRLAKAVWCSVTSQAVTNLPTYSDNKLWSNKDTATFNTQKILDFCAAKSGTSSACTHCRSKSFVIDGVTYYGQLPSVNQMVDILRNRIALNAADTTAGSYSSLIIPESGNNPYILGKKKKKSTGYSWAFFQGGTMENWVSDERPMIFPVLEIPMVETNTLTVNITSNFDRFNYINVNGIKRYKSEFVNNSLDIVFATGTEIVWSANLSSSLYTANPASGSLTLDTDSSINIDITRNY